MAGKAVRATVERTGKVPRYNTAGVREGEHAYRTREAGNRDGVEGVVVNTLKSLRNGAVGFIGWLGDLAPPFQQTWQ
jgi:hypothetical protein